MNPPEINSCWYRCPSNHQAEANAAAHLPPPANHRWQSEHACGAPRSVTEAESTSCFRRPGGLADKNPFTIHY